MRKSHFTLVPERGAGSAELKIGLRSAPCLADHRVHGMVVPGSFYIAAAAVLHREVFDAPAEILENVQFENPTGKVRRGSTAPQTTGPGPVPSAARLLTCPPPPSFARFFTSVAPPPPCELRAILALTSDRSIGRAQRYAWQPFAPVEAARGEEAGGGADLPQPPRHIRRPPLARISPSAGRPGLPRPRRPPTSSSERPSRPCRARACSRGAPSLPARCPGFRACCGFR
jgi:hypothetical protein